MVVEKRPLGSQGLLAPAQGLGLMGMSSFYVDHDHKATEEENWKVIERAQELGVTFLDTSDVYGPHTNEEMLGRVLKGRSEQFQIATKFGIEITATGMRFNGSPDYVKSACDASLKRLGIKTIDLYYQHRVDPNVPIEKTVAAMKELVEAGKVKYLGLSEVNAEDIRKAHAVHPITAVQLEWSLWTRDAEAEVIPTCRSLGIGIVPYSPLGRGFLAGKYTDTKQYGEGDFRHSNPRFNGEAFEKNLKLVGRMTELAKAKGCKPGQLALAWVQHQGEDVFPIPGTKRLGYLEENIASLDIKLSKEELKLLEDAVPASEVVGERYDEALMASTHQQYGGKK